MCDLGLDACVCELLRDGVVTGLPLLDVLVRALHIWLHRRPPGSAPRLVVLHALLPSVIVALGLDEVT